MKFLFVCVATFFSGLWAKGAIVLNENFSYADGPIVGASGSPWNAHSGSGANEEALIVSEKLQLTFARSEDVNAPLAGQPYPTASGTVLYSSFTVNFSALPTVSGEYFAGFKDSSLNYRARIFASRTGAPTGFFRLGIGNSSGASAASGQWPDNLSTNLNYFVVTRYNVANGSSTVWINPLAESDPGVSATDTPGPITITSFAFRQTSGEGTMLIDDLKVGTSFAEVISSNSVSAPTILMQPESQTVFAGTTASFSVAANGSAPLHYQWQFNATNLPNATNAALSLTNVTSANAGNYLVIVSNNINSVTSDVVTLTVAAQALPALSILTYNVKGNGTTNWSTNTAQVQAIGRQMIFLNADIITFNEIPYTNTSEMTNFVKAFLPGYFLATNSGTDGFIRSVIASRFPITRSKNWLDGADLKPFGYTNTSSTAADNFTRDLFEAQISVPEFSQPMHVFTTHLKSSSTNYTEAAAKRAAEAAAITNFFATNFFILYPADPYVLTGDMNEANTNTLALQRLVSAPTGLRLTNPTNPVSGSINTFSIQGSLSSRIDYIFPGGLLFSNIISSQVFRTDLLNPMPSGLQTNDDKTASDHLPVMMVFANPYDTPFRITSQILSNHLLTLNWQSSSGRQYRVESSTTLTNWIPWSVTFRATGTNLDFTTNVSGNANFFRVYRLP